MGKIKKGDFIVLGIILLILVTAIVGSMYLLDINAFAADDNNNNNNSETETCPPHHWVNGECTKCKMKCNHDESYGRSYSHTNGASSLENRDAHYIICNNCGTTLRAELCEPGEWIVNTPNRGSGHYNTCKYCGEKLNEQEHHFTEITIPATCTSEGTITSTCDECGYSSRSEKNGDALGHDWNGAQWTDNGNGTCSRTCQRENCGYKDTEEHNFVNNECTRCGATERK